MEQLLNNLLYEAFAEASDSVYVYVTDLNTDETRMSKNAVEYFDLPGEYINGLANIWIEKIHPQDREGYAEDLEGVLSGKSTRHSYQYRIKNRYGDYVWVECKGSVKTGQKEERIFAGLITRLDVQSLYDPLTGLPSKNQFYEYDFSKEKYVLMLLGIDNFRQLINVYGYNIGDEILVQIGKLFAVHNGDDVTVYRFNGDEFIVSFKGSDLEKAKNCFESILNQVDGLVLENGRKIKLTFSAGAILSIPGQLTKDCMVDRLEDTLDFVKKTKKGTIAFYSKQIAQKMHRIQLLKKELKASILNNFEGFEVHYQPWMDVQGMRISGCEALLRWKGKEITDAGPAEFIPILEESDDILSVGDFVMRESMKQQKLWEKKYGEFVVSFNVSYRQFLQEDYVEKLEKTAKEIGVNPCNMIIELTESCRVQAPNLLADVFRRLRRVGFKIALDDFGTGYASMEMLKRLPVDGVKIEHSFVRELEKEGHDMDFAIIESILHLCNRVGRDVIVEGVENREVDMIVRDMNVKYLQGYFYSKPICKTDFEKLMMQQ